MDVIALVVGELTAYLTVNKDDYRRGIQDAKGDMRGLEQDAERSASGVASKTERMVSSVASSVSKMTAAYEKAKRAEFDAANAVTLAETRLNEARKKGLTEGSAQALSLTSALEKAQYRLAQAQKATIASTNDLGAAQRALANDPEIERSGEKVGGKLSQGISQGIIRNSPLIVAGVAAALTAGAPAMLSAGTALFAGVGIVAAAQSDRVKAAWLGTWTQIKTGAISDARVIEPVLTGMAGQIGASFERMRPLIRDAFSAAAPQMKVFTDGITDLAENAMPGLVRAVEAGMPVTEGLADFMAKVGAGLSDFFDRISEHSGAAGEVWSSLGDSMATLLPILGELLGQGAELAADVLPLLNSSLGLVLKVVDLLGPALPIVAAGFGALKIAQSVSGGVTSLAGALERYAASSGAGAGLAGKMAGGLGSLAAAAGPAAAAVGFVVAGIMTWNDLVEKTADLNVALGRSFEVGGTMAENSKQYIDNWMGSLTPIANNLPSFITGVSLFGTTIGEIIPSAENAKTAYEDWYAGLGEGAQATEDVTVATAALKQAVDDYGPGSRAAAKAADELSAAESNAASIADDYEMSISGVTEAMLAQADAALALADADLAHRQAIDQADDSYAALNEAIAEFGATSEEASDAAMDWEGDLSRLVATAGKLATDTLPANMDANQKLALSQIAQRDALRDLAAQYGDKLPPALQTALASLEATTAGYDVAALEAAALSAETENATGKMEKLGKTEANPKITGDASVFAGVEADTASKLDKLNTTESVPKIKGDSSIFAGVHADTMSKVKQIDDQRPTPYAFLNNGPFAGIWGAVMGQIGTLGGQRPQPSVFLADYASGGISKVEQKLLGLRDRTIYITTVEQTIKSKAGGGAIRAAAGRKISGPGGPTDDVIPAIGPGGSRYLLSNSEWIVNAMASRAQGDAKMAALNAGLADIVMRSDRPVRGFATGGTPRLNPTTGTGQTSSGITVNGGITVKVETPLNLMSRQDLRRAAVVIEGELVKLQTASR